MYKDKTIIMIAAVQEEDLAIGKGKDLVHKFKKDMEHFVEMTTGHSIIMGRKNWESIPERFRPFKNRENIILTRQKDFKAEGATVVHTIEEAFERSRSETIYVIGGAEVYSLALPYADILDLTLIDAKKEADTFFPKFDNDFEIILSKETITDEKTGINFQFQLWKRK